MATILHRDLGPMPEPLGPSEDERMARWLAHRTDIEKLTADSYRVRVARQFTATCTTREQAQLLAVALLAQRQADDARRFGPSVRFSYRWSRCAHNDGTTSWSIEIEGEDY